MVESLPKGVNVKDVDIVVELIGGSEGPKN